jgi:hypothetical protein
VGKSAPRRGGDPTTDIDRDEDGGMKTMKFPSLTLIGQVLQVKVR